MEICRDHLAEHGEQGDVAEFDAFASQCLELDGLALVEYAIQLLDRGCAINLDGMHRRRLQQYLAARLSSSAPTCGWDEIDDLALEIDRVCCGADGSACPVVGRLPDASQGAQHLRDVFYR